MRFGLIAKTHTAFVAFAQRTCPLRLTSGDPKKHDTAAEAHAPKPRASRPRGRLTPEIETLDQGLVPLGVFTI